MQWFIKLKKEKEKKEFQSEGAPKRECTGHFRQAGSSPRLPLGRDGKCDLGDRGDTKV